MTSRECLTSHFRNVTQGFIVKKIFIIWRSLGTFGRCTRVENAGEDPVLSPYPYPMCASMVWAGTDREYYTQDLPTVKQL